MRKPWRIVALVLFLSTTVVAALVGDKVLARGDKTREALRVYTELMSLAHEGYGDEVSYQDLVFASINGMLRTLDPHTAFLSPRAYTGMRERQQSTFYGLGILVSMRNGRLTIMTPIEGTPASRLGLRPGDIISAIEGEPTDTMTLDEAVERLKGPKGTKVAIEVMRRGLSEPLQLTVTRAEIPQTTVRHAFMLDESTGYIWLTDFNRGTAQEVADAIDRLKGEGMRQLIFDLRNNGGGLLDQAIDVADQFVPDAGSIVETRGRTPDSIQAYEAADKYAPLEQPVVVLVNRGTASAAEIVSGAIQDHDMGLVVGTPTWGKGLVQTVYNLPYGAGLALTTAKYYTPSGRLIQRDYSSYYDYVTAGGPDAQAEPTPHEPGDEVFYTDLGRKVYGGGGITPDVIVEADELTVFEQFLLTRNAFLDFAVDYLNRNPGVAQSPDWQPGEEVLDRFKTWLIDEEVASPQKVEEGLAENGNGDYALHMIRGEVLNSRFGQEAQQRALAEGDRQLQRALELLDQAGELLARHQDLDPDHPLQQARAFPAYDATP